MKPGELLDHALVQLRERSDSARLDAELLLAHALDRPRGSLHAWLDEACDAEAAARFKALVQRRVRGEPIAYLLGRKAFWSLDLIVTPDVLIPRPETELLVEWALSIVDSSFPRKRESRLSLLDLGTGSGAVALSLGNELPMASVLATDISHKALLVAAENARWAGLGNVEFLLGSWFKPLDSHPRDAQRTFDLIVSNPPYIRTRDRHLHDLRCEPRQALVAGNEGLDALRLIVSQAPQRLNDGGWLLVEHGYDQATAVRALFADAGFSRTETRRDLSGHERATGGRKSK